MGKPSTAVVPQASSPIVPMSDGEAAFKKYAELRDLVLSTPFANNRSIARQGTPFTILRVLDNITTDPDIVNNKPGREQICYLIELEAGYLHEDPDHPENDAAFEAAQIMKLALDRNKWRDKDQELIARLVDENGALPHMTLQQYPATKPGMSPSHGIVHKDSWQALKDVTASRNGKA